MGIFSFNGDLMIHPLCQILPTEPQVVTHPNAFDVVAISAVTRCVNTDNGVQIVLAVEETEEAVKCDFTKRWLSHIQY